MKSSGMGGFSREGMKIRDLQGMSEEVVNKVGGGGERWFKEKNHADTRGVLKGFTDLARDLEDTVFDTCVELDSAHC